MSLIQSLLLIIICLITLHRPVVARSEAVSPANAVQASEEAESLSTDVVQAMETTLSQEKDKLANLKQTLESEQQKLSGTRNNPETNVVEDAAVKEAELNRDAAEVTQDKLQLDIRSLGDQLTAQQENLESQSKKLKELQLAVEKNDAIQVQISEQESKIAESTQLIEVLKDIELTLAERQKIASQLLKVTTENYKLLQERFQQQIQQKLQHQTDQINLQYLNEIKTLRQTLATLNDKGTSTQRDLLEARIHVTEEKIDQASRDARLLAYQKQLTEWQTLVTDAPETVKQSDLNEALKLGKDLQTLKTSLEESRQLIQQEQTILQRRQETLSREELSDNKTAQQLLQGIDVQLQNQLKTLPPLLDSSRTTITALENAYKTNVQQKLFRQRVLPENMTDWEVLGQDARAVFGIFSNHLFATLDHFEQTFSQISSQRWLLIALLLLMVLLIFVFLRNRLRHLFQKLSNAAEQSFVADIIMTYLQLLHMNVFSLLFAAIFGIFIWQAHVNPGSALFAFILIFPWLIFKIPVDLSWLLLINNEDGCLTAENKKIYSSLRRLFLSMGLIVVITALAHMLPIALSVRDIVDTVFMLLLSLAVIPVMQIRNAALGLLRKNTAIKQYWLFVARIVSMVIPLSVFAVTVLGLVGYINLGWYVAYILSLLFLVITGGLILKGLLADVINLLKNYALRTSRHGLLWTQDIIPLFDKLLNIALLFGIAWFFIWLAGWYNDTAMRQNMESIANYPLLPIGDTQFTISNLVLSLFTLWFVFWFGSWMRRVTYSWIYQGISDLGVRNSLSVFTQYFVVLIGLLIALNLVGLDLTTLAVFAGALGVGIGLGLQNIAQNFFSGILLLIERPLRTGDIVNVGGNEGTVTQIGMRSLTLKNWDKQDVIIPNSELTANTFTNWTRGDNVLRITLIIGISYDDDPHHAKQILVETFPQHTDVLKQPAPVITLWEFADSSVNFRIDFYINIVSTSSFATRDQLLFTIWDRFKAEGISIPYPQHDIHVRQIPKQVMGA